MKPRFTGLPLFVHPVADMPQARKFYTEVLGLAETANREDQWVGFDLGDGTLARSGFMIGSAPGLAGCAGLETGDFDGAVAHLKARGVRFVMEPADTGVCRFARFLDSEGNHPALHRHH